MAEVCIPVRAKFPDMKDSLDFLVNYHLMQFNSLEDLCRLWITSKRLRGKLSKCYELWFLYAYWISHDVPLHAKLRRPFVNFNRQIIEVFFEMHHSKHVVPDYIVKYIIASIVAKKGGVHVVVDKAKILLGSERYIDNKFVFKTDESKKHEYESLKLSQSII
ncbi:MAG: hypothetical protein Hyperionvirus2_40 [Hyperionvirus sp.]|uniref:Uncharacterized protein n=1 Tax=Hyperionvirus sp. TaxID=2487770 RepID=A0A3G5A6L3_9VIRU|nr:MAG: hypothetical protein Hyperionvirus2_40 [Hyperionvirus sp.]